MSILNVSECSFVYCISSNKEKIPCELDLDYFSTQLEYSGILKGLDFFKKIFQHVFDSKVFIYINYYI